ncbi:hypothetical protein C8R42DRAFT_641027 [Lentinula raphanica]|nr:hypothetical protein C8R42DRAFT_641027 [Lentinula raphanica]
MTTRYPENREVNSTFSVRESIQSGKAIYIIWSLHRNGKKDKPKTSSAPSIFKFRELQHSGEMLLEYPEESRFATETLTPPKKKPRIVRRIFLATTALTGTIYVGSAFLAFNNTDYYDFFSEHVPLVRTATSIKDFIVEKVNGAPTSVKEVKERVEKSAHDAKVTTIRTVEASNERVKDVAAHVRTNVQKEEGNWLRVLKTPAGIYQIVREEGGGRVSLVIFFASHALPFHHASDYFFYAFQSYWSSYFEPVKSNVFEDSRRVLDCYFSSPLNPPRSTSTFFSQALPFADNLHNLRRHQVQFYMGGVVRTGRWKTKSDREQNVNLQCGERCTRTHHRMGFTSFASFNPGGTNDFRLSLSDAKMIIVSLLPPPRVFIATSSSSTRSSVVVWCKLRKEHAVAFYHSDGKLLTCVLRASAIMLALAFFVRKGFFVQGF